MKNIKQTIITIIICAVIIAGVNILYAWTGPTGTPPNNNVTAPINIGSTAQQKTGSLRVGGLTSDYDTYLANISGGVGIGTATNGWKLRVGGNTQLTNWLDVGGNITANAGSISAIGLTGTSWITTPGNIHAGETVDANNFKLNGTTNCNGARSIFTDSNGYLYCDNNAPITKSYSATKAGSKQSFTIPDVTTGTHICFLNQMVLMCDQAGSQCNVYRSGNQWMLEVGSGCGSNATTCSVFCFKAKGDPAY